MGQLIFKRLKIFTISFFLLSSSFFSESNDEIMSDENIVKSISISNIDGDFSRFKRGNDRKDPLKFYQIDFSNKYNYEFKSIAIPDSTLRKEFILETGEFLKVTGPDNNEQLFNGSFSIQFKSSPNFENYAVQNDLIFVTSLSDINIGVFKVRNIFELSTVFDQIKDDSNIESIELNLVNPNIYKH
jgi:hypothetical protein